MDQPTRHHRRWISVGSRGGEEHLPDTPLATPRASDIEGHERDQHDDYDETPTGTEGGTADEQPRGSESTHPVTEPPPAPEAWVSNEPEEPEAQPASEHPDPEAEQSGFSGPYARPTQPLYARHNCGFEWPDQDLHGRRINKGCGRPPYISVEEWCRSLHSKKARQAETHRYIVAEKARRAGVENAEAAAPATFASAKAAREHRRELRSYHKRTQDPLPAIRVGVAVVPTTTSSDDVVQALPAPAHTMVEFCCGKTAGLGTKILLGDARSRGSRRTTMC